MDNPNIHLYAHQDRDQQSHKTLIVASEFILLYHESYSTVGVFPKVILTSKLEVDQPIYADTQYEVLL